MNLNWLVFAFRLLLAFCVTVPAMAATRPEESATASTLTVMSFNIRYGTANDGDNHWKKRREMLFDVFRRHRPDVVGLQEALKFQLDELREALPEFEQIGVARDDGRSKGEFNTILYRKELLRPVESGDFWYSDTPELPGSMSWGNHLPRICTWARFVPVTPSGRIDGSGPHLNAFYHFNTHFDHQSQPSRERSAELLIERIQSRRHDDPFVVTGDLNAREDNKAVLYLLGKAPRASSGPAEEHVPLKLMDTYRVLYPTARDSGTFNGFKGTRTGPKIDYIFIPGGVKVLEAAILRDGQDGRYPSDHFPIMAVVRFGG